MQSNELKQIVAPLLNWYHTNKRDLPWRKNTDPYGVWISEIMLQQTRVETVIPYYEHFMEHYPTISSLAASKDEELLKLWEGLGYYSRAKNLKKASQIICNQYHGYFPKQYDDILALPGIGAYTAGAIASISFEQAKAAVDGNVLRVITRLTENGHDITDIAFRRQITAELEKIYPTRQRGDFTQSLMELGAVVCIPNGLPKCSQCPLHVLCGACQNGTQLQYPIKKQILEQLAQMQPQFDMHRSIICQKERLKHIFTHIEWHMECMLIECAAEYELDNIIWVTHEELEAKIALPTAFRKVYEKMRE